MAYLTLQQLIDRYGEPALVRLSDRAEEPTEIVDATVVARAIADAEATIDGYLFGRYALPLATVPAQVEQIAAVLAYWNLHTVEPDAKVKADYDSVMKLLREIGSGAFRLQVAGLEPAATGGSGARMTDRERPMTEANLKGFI